MMVEVDARPLLDPGEGDAGRGGVDRGGDADQRVEQVVGAVVEGARDARAAAGLVLAMVGALVLAAERRRRAAGPTA